MPANRERALRPASRVGSKTKIPRPPGGLKDAAIWPSSEGRLAVQSEARVGRGDRKKERGSRGASGKGGGSKRTRKIRREKGMTVDTR